MRDRPPQTVMQTLDAAVQKYGKSPALRWKTGAGVWKDMSWADYQAEVKRAAKGMIALGLEPHKGVSLVGFNCKEWLIGNLAAIHAGGVPVGIYTTSTPEQCQYIAGHSDSNLAIVENAEQLAKFLEIRGELEQLAAIIVMHGEHPDERVFSWAELLAKGDALADSELDARMAAQSTDDICTLIYTSGTTGEPKGVMLSHDNLTWTSASAASTMQIQSDSVLLSYLPLSHIAEQLGTLHIPLLIGAQVYFAESLEKMPENLRQARPTCFFGVPRVWEKFKARAEERMAGLPERRQKILAWARKIATDRNLRELAGDRVPLAVEAQYRLAQRLVFQPMRERIGFDRTRIFVTSAAPIGKDVLDFFLSVDMVLREVYGQSEVTGPTSANAVDCTRLGSLGRAMMGVEVKIGDDGEILVRGENVCLGYYKDPEATAELLEGGWLHSGDVGEFDPEGFLRITGRKKEIIVTSGGKKTAPANIEGLIKAIPPVGNALVVGDSRNYLVALIALDPEKVPAFAQGKGWPAEPAALAASPDFLAYLDERLRADVNARLSKFETIKRFHVLPDDFTVDGGELTPTLKVRRKVVEQKYRPQIEALYAASEEGARVGQTG